MKRLPGFTLIELIVVMAIIMLLTGLVWTSVWGSQHQSSLNSTLTTFISDLKAQQAKAMLGDTEGRSTADSYGIYLGSTQYILFHGTTYNSGDSANFTIALDPNLRITTTFPSSVVIFQKGSGELLNFSSPNNTISFSDATNTVIKTLTLNQYGVVISQN